MKGVAKAGLLAAALAGTTDAFQTPMSLRPVPGAHGSSIKNVAQAPSLRKAAKQSSRTATMLFGPNFSKVGGSKGSSDIAKVAEENWTEWNQALLAKDYKKVAAMYSAADVSVLPTASGELVQGSQKILDMIESETTGTITEQSIQSLNEDAYVHTGLKEIKDGSIARFSYIWNKVNGSWKIVHQHSSISPASKDIMTPIAEENFKRWNDALVAKDYDKVASLYCSKELSFLPTVSPKFIQDTKETKDYFVDFVKKLPSGTITSQNVQPYGSDAYLHSGMYTFMTGPESARAPVEARFSYMWRIVDGEWKIVHHHSSAVPKAAGSAAAEVTAEKMYPTAQENFKKWNDALKAKDYYKVASLYSDQELSFLPTVSPKFIKDFDSTKDYFIDFVKKLPDGTITADDVQPYGPDAYLHTGMYTFMTGPAEARAPVEARFSYMWRKVNGEWKIVHHHSSAVPGKAPPPAAKAEAKEGGMMNWLFGKGSEGEAAAAPQVDEEAMYSTAMDNFKRWNDALKEKNFDKVAGLYSSDRLSFLPTVSPKFIKDGKDTKDYFVDFVKKLPDGTITADDVQSYGPDAYLHTGMYTFMTGPADARAPVDARFSYMWRKVNGEWKIVHHHSSAVPKTAGSAAAEVTAEKMYPTAQENFKRWNDALQTKNPKQVAALYSSRILSFLPTVSSEFIKDSGKPTEDYFVEFIKKNPSGTITADDVQPYGDDAYLHTGMYTFMTGPEGDRAPVEARFSYMWRIVDGSWKITHHHSSASPGKNVPKEEDYYPTAQENFKKWNDALQTKDPKQVAALYSATDLSFLPTVSGDFIKDSGKPTEDYFVAFIKKQPAGTITGDKVQSYGPDAYLHTGMYTFMTGPADARAPVEARFSYMWRKVDGEWKITHHHSSATPGKNVPKEEDYYPVAQTNFKKWNDALQTKDPKQVAALYSATDLSFLPTVSGDFIKDSGKPTEEYFVEFIKKNPSGTITGDKVQSYGPDAYLHTGMYTFMTGPADARAPVEARFSYMWRKVDGEWKITHHHSSATPGKNVPKEEDYYPTAQTNFKKWNDALQTKDPKQVAALYSATDLSFLPTVSGDFIKDSGKPTEEYFVEFIKKNPAGTITGDKVQSYGPDAYLHTGMYTFMTGPADARAPVEARFSYMWRKVNGEWKITHHHSSATPGKNVPAPVDNYPTAQENFKKWNDALQTKDPKKVAALYSAKDLSFLPTVSPEFIKDGGKPTEDYFVAFIQKQPFGEITADDVKSFGNDAYLHTGMYTFMTGPADARAPVEARFSYMWRKIEGQWKIVHHHSSATPGKNMPSNADMYPNAQTNFKKWNDALQTKDPKQVAALYASKELSFLPTVSPKFIKDGGKDTEDYFVEFVKKLPDGKITADDVKAFGPDAYLHTGMYTFMTGPSNARAPVEARFSYMWRQIDGEWKIVHHHSSATPKAAGSAAAEATAEKMYPKAQENFKRWNDALQTKDPKQVAALYSSKVLSFLPTVSGDFIKDSGKPTEDYFVEFIKKQPAGTITADDVQPYGDDAYLHTGMYTFMTGPADARAPVEARFSYMWRIVDGSWKITHHHSSATPGKNVPKQEDMYPKAQENFKKWNDALQTKDPKQVAALYSAKDLSFLPTVSGDFIKDGGKPTEDYFVAFIKKNPSGTITADDVKAFGNDAYLHTGMYTFMTGPADDRAPVEARFSYMWRIVDGEWKIVHHHSSATPGKNVPAPVDNYPVAQTNFKKWNDSLQTKDPKQVAALYSATDLSFLPTVSGDFIKDSGKPTEEYFVEFIKKNPAGTITGDKVQSFGNDAYLHTGMYTFMTGPADARAPVEARFSYMWRKVDGEWKIGHHHSSATPGKNVPAPVDNYPVAQANFKKWNDALQTKDPKQVAALYSATDLSFLPTVSGDFIKDSGKPTEEYFVEFIKKNPAGTITGDKVQSFGNDAYLHTGMYTFMTGPADARAPVEARFSYMWRKVDGEWKIVHHHSSATPGKNVPAPVDNYPTAQENFKKWNDALQTKDPKKVAALYSATDLSFLPTVSPEFIKDGGKPTEDYFVAFIKKNPHGVITADDVKSFGNDAYLHTGMYTFMTGPEGDRAPVEARFSYMWRQIDGEWKIVHHHSSATPGKNVPKEEDYYPVAQTNFKKWNDALQTKDPKQVAALYSATDLSFLPTVSGDFIKDSGKPTEDYFVSFIKKNPAGTITGDKVQSYGPDAYLHTGMYTFMTGPADARAPVEARFSYMWRKVDGEWKITHHHSSATPGKNVPKEEDYYPVAQTNFKKWNDALQTKDPKQVAALYSATDLSFLPTVSGDFIKDSGKPTEEYFVEFIKKNPAGTITGDKVQSYGPDAYLHTGMYTFMTGPADARAPVEARFSYMWRKVDGEWKITHHHSSATPGKNVPKQEDMYPKAQENFKKWNDALQTKDPKQVASLYTAKDLSFLPTVSGDFIKDGGKPTEDYFVAFIQKNPSGTITADDVKAFGNDAYLHTGMYTFMTGPADDRAPVEARFSYMWRIVDGEWKIVHHHSSATPGKNQPKEIDYYGLAQENFKKWNDALLAKDYRMVADLYSKDDLSFLPTVSPEFIKDPVSTQEYFQAFLKKLPDGTITADDVKPAGPDAYLHTGMYTFMTGHKGDRQPVEARFSYMWKKQTDGSWKIVHHHSSAVPEGAKEPAPFTLTTSQDTTGDDSAAITTYTSKDEMDPRNPPPVYRRGDPAAPRFR